MTAVTANSAVSAMADASSLITSLTDSTQEFLQPSPTLHREALACLKSLLDPLAANVADTQKTRRDENRKKRKRGDVEAEEEVLHLRQVYTAGLGVKQVWEQARRVLDAACLEVEREISIRKAQSQHDLRQDGVNGEAIEDEEMSEELVEGSDVSEDELADDDSDEDLLEDGMDYDDYEDQEDAEDIEDIEEDEDSDTHADKDHAATYVPDPNGLNDGFFSIDDFNKQTQFLEQQDARGEDDNPSDEDEIDWDVDPLTMPFHKPKSGQEEIIETQDDKEDDDEEDGPTFGNADLDAADSDEDISQDENLDLENGMPTISNTNDIRYANFFAPPPKKQSRTKRMRALPKTQPATASKPQDASGLESDMQRAMADVRRDLLESDEELSDTDGSDSDDLRPSNKKNMSTHERQRAAIASEIRRLEAANVAKRDWTLSGEARAADRPLNSLIEEDLEFERTGKPVPVITAEVSEEIEALIKRRILAREFDEVVRRHPDALGAANDTRRGRVEVDDTKPQSGLAEVYEQDHLRATDPGYVDRRSAATKRAHEEISRLWKEVSSQLDLLSNLHFKPKRVEAEVTTVEDKPTISMEDARPVGAGVNAEESMLAPQEVYRPGQDKGAGSGAGGEEGVLFTRKGGASVNKDEMTREERIRRRRREKERTKKASASSSRPSKGSAANGGGASQAAGGGRKSKAQDQAELLSDLRKGNVKVVDKKGELQDIAGKKGNRATRDVAGGPAGPTSASSFKL